MLHSVGNVGMYNSMTFEIISQGTYLLYCHRNSYIAKFKLYLRLYVGMYKCLLARHLKSFHKVDIYYIAIVIHR